MYFGALDDAGPHVIDSSLGILYALIEDQGFLSLAVVVALSDVSKLAKHTIENLACSEGGKTPHPHTLCRH